MVPSFIPSIPIPEISRSNCVKDSYMKFIYTTTLHTEYHILRRKIPAGYVKAVRLVHSSHSIYWKIYLEKLFHLSNPSAEEHNFVERNVWLNVYHPWDCK
jgi:hypothetical protein